MLDFLKLPSLTETDESEQTEEEAKAERIRFHREKVRNGPTTFRHITGGMIRRAKYRDLTRNARKVRRGQIRDFLASEREIAVLRGHLQAVGVLSYASDFVAPDELRLVAATALVRRFGDLTEDGEQILRTSIQRAYDRYCTLVGQETSPVEFVD